MKRKFFRDYRLGFFQPTLYQNVFFEQLGRFENSNLCDKEELILKFKRKLFRDYRLGFFQPTLYQNFFFWTVRQVWKMRFFEARIKMLKMRRFWRSLYRCIISFFKPIILYTDRLDHFLNEVSRGKSTIVEYDRCGKTQFSSHALSFRQCETSIKSVSDWFTLFLKTKLLRQNMPNFYQQSLHQKPQRCMGEQEKNLNVWLKYQNPDHANFAKRFPKLIWIDISTHIARKRKTDYRFFVKKNLNWNIYSCRVR